MIYDGAADEFILGYRQSSYFVNTENGFTFTIKPDALLRWREAEQVNVRVIVEDNDSQEINFVYNFTAEERRLGFSIYNMVLKSLRDMDEKKS